MSIAPVTRAVVRKPNTAAIIAAIRSRCAKWDQAPTKHTSLLGKQLAAKIIGEDVPVLIALAGQAARPQASDGDLLRLLHGAVRTDGDGGMIPVDEPIKAGDAVRLAYAALLAAGFTGPAPEPRTTGDT